MVFFCVKEQRWKIMNGRMKKTAAIASVLGVVAIAFLAIPIQAYVTRTGDSDLLQTQDRERLRTQDCDCDVVQTQTRERLRTQESDDNRDMLHTEEPERPGTRDRVCSCTMNRERYSHQDREKTGNLGN
jgi:hypothetical protein